MEEYKKITYPIYFEDGSFLTEDRMLHVPCSICGGYIKTTSGGSRKNRICDSCKRKINVMKPVSRKISAESNDKHNKRFDKAVKEIKKQVSNFSKYERSVEIARTRLYEYDSVPEAMVAIELLRLRYKIIPQQKIGKYRVDFLLPDEKIVIEVDGSIYHARNKSSDREAVIQISLGFDWKIIHISAELIAKDIGKLKKCIELYR